MRTSPGRCVVMGDPGWESAPLISLSLFPFCNFNQVSPRALAKWSSTDNPVTLTVDGSLSSRDDGLVWPPPLVVEESAATSDADDADDDDVDDANRCVYRSPSERRKCSSITGSLIPELMCRCGILPVSAGR